jgi:hypothetical protein
MTDEQPILPEDSIEDLAPDEDGEQVAGGALNAYIKIDGVQGQSYKESSLKITPTSTEFGSGGGAG